MKAVGPAEGSSSYDLAHHYTSVLMASGESVVGVAERLGHKNGALVLITCGHLLPGSEEGRQAVDLAWGPPDVPQAETDVP